MASQFSDPAWWPTPPPKPPKPISLTKVVFGTLLPVVAVAAVAAWVITQHSSGPGAAPTRSIAAFEACLRSHGAAPGTASNTAATQQAARACADRLPVGTQLGAFGQQRPEQQGTQAAFNECIQSATAGLGGSRGRFGGSSDAFRNAIELCRALTAGSGGPGTTTQPAPTTTAPSAA